MGVDEGNLLEFSGLVETVANTARDLLNPDHLLVTQLVVLTVRRRTRAAFAWLLRCS